MKFNNKLALLILLALISLPAIANAQTTKPRCGRRRHARRSCRQCANRNEFKGSLERHSVEQGVRAGDRFTAVAIDPVRFNEATVHRSYPLDRKIRNGEGPNDDESSFDSIELPGRSTKHGVVHAMSHEFTEPKRAPIKRRGPIGRPRQSNAETERHRRDGRCDHRRHRGRWQRSRDRSDLGGAGGAGSLAINGSKELRIDSGTEMLVHVTR